MSKTKQVFFAGLIYFFIILLFFWPCLGRLSTALIGPPEDNMQFFWFLWYGSESLLKHHWPFMHSSMIYYPEGVDLFYANYFYYGVFAAVALKAFFNLIFIFNFLILNSFVISGVGTFLLIQYLFQIRHSEDPERAKRVEGDEESQSVRSFVALRAPQDDVGSFLASLAGGYIFAFNPSHIAHAAHHVTIASIQFVPFFALFFIKSLRENKKKDLILAAFFLVLNALCDWNYLIFGLVFMFLGYVYLAASRRRILWREFLKIAFITGLTFIILSPILVPMIQSGWQADFKRKLPGHNMFVADLSGFFVPSDTHWLAKMGWINAANSLMTGTAWEKAVYLGWANILLLAFCARDLFRENKKYFLALLAFAILAMGSQLHALGKVLPVSLPYKFFENIPFLTQARNPSRIIVYSYLFLAILVSAALQNIFMRKKSKILFAAVLALILIDYSSFCSAMTPVDVPECYAAVRKDPQKDFAVLDVPWDGARYMMYQTIHGIPEVQGYLGRRTNGTLGDRLSFDLKDLGPQKKTLIENKVKYIVIHKKRLNWNPDDPNDQSYFKIMRYASVVYSRFYEKIYEDDLATTFRVYD